MSTDADVELQARSEDPESPSLPDSVKATETYRTDEGTVFYDADNPIAWIQADEPVQLDDVQ